MPPNERHHFFTSDGLVPFGGRAPQPGLPFHPWGINYFVRPVGPPPPYSGPPPVVEVAEPPPLFPIGVMGPYFMPYPVLVAPPPPPPTDPPPVSVPILAPPQIYVRAAVPAPPLAPAPAPAPAQPSPPTPPASPVSPSAPPDPPGATLPGATTTFTNGMTSYIYPRHHAIIHLIAHKHQPWLHPSKPFDFTTHPVGTNLTIKDLILQLGVPGDRDEDRGIVECINVGDGRWLKGSVFRLGEGRSERTLQRIGWGASRGVEREPVWLAVYLP